MSFNSAAWTLPAEGFDLRNFNTVAFICSSFAVMLNEIQHISKLGSGPQFIPNICLMIWHLWVLGEMNTF